MDCCTSTRTYFKAQGLLPATKGHYRRSVTTKAPRKRTFIANMEKYSPGVRSAGAGGSLCKLNAFTSVHVDVLESCCGGNDTGCGGNNGSRVGRQLRAASGDDGSMGGANPVPRAVILGVAVLMAGLVLLPNQAAASATSRPASRVASASMSTPSAPRNMCLSAVDMPTSGSNGLPEDAIIYGHVQLTKAERKMVGRRQQFFRETLRCEALGC